jgi:hypothetical protein
MKKSFFKKLSFVLVLAMVMALIVPATGAFAAAAPKLNAAKKYLHLDVEGQNEYDFNIKNKQSGWKYLWESSDEDVVEVDNVGLVTATGVGTAKVTVYITDKSGEEVADLTATVIVRDNIKEVTITNKPDGDKLAVGVEHDFNRSFVTVSGSTKKTSAITRWSVTPEGATIDEKGVFVASKAGKYTVTALSFQSKEKYNLWKADAEANAGYVLDTDTYEVTVAPSVVGVQQKTFTTAELTFDADMSAEVNATNLKLYRIVAGVSQPVEMMVKKVSFDTTGTVATVETYVDFAGGETYELAYGDLKARFEAAKADVDQVASVVLQTKEAVYTQGGTSLDVKLFNAAGVDITTTALKARVTYAITNNVGYLNGNTLVLFAKGDVAAIKATFHTYTYDANYNEIVVEGTGQVVAVDAASYTLGSNVEWTLATSAPDWSKAKVTKLAAGDTGYSVWARVRSTNSNVEEYYYSYGGGPKAVANNDATKFTFESSNKDVLIVDTYGTIFPVQAGNVVIICKYDGKAIATFPVEITGARAAATFSIDKNAVTLTNSAAVGAKEEVKLTIKDQLGADFNTDPSKIKIEAMKSNPDSGAGLGPVGFRAASNNLIIDVAGSGVTKGTWTYKVTAYDKVQILVVTIQEPARDNDADYVDDVTYWQLTLSTSSVDTAVTSDGALKSVTPTLLGYASNGVAVYKATWSDGFYYTVTSGGTAVTKGTPTDGSIEVAFANGTLASPVQTVASAGAITARTGVFVDTLANGAYIVTAYDSAGNVKGQASFSVGNTKAAPSYSYEKTQTTETYILKAVRDCFKISLSGSEIADADLYGVSYVVGGTPHDYSNTNDTNDDTVASGTTVLVKSVKFIKIFTIGSDNYAVEYTATINRSIYIK